MFHLSSLFPTQLYLPPEDVKKLEWSDATEKAHIASARLDLYDSLENAEHEGTKAPKLDPELLKVFLWFKDYGVCTRAFNRCLDLVSICPYGTLGDADGTRMFIPERIGSEWVAHFILVLCKGEDRRRAASWALLRSCLVPKWAMLPPSWCHDFASALLFTVNVVQPPDIPELPAYQCLANTHTFMTVDEQQAFLPFLATLLELTKSTLTQNGIISLGNWLAELPASLENQAAHIQIESILATSKQQFVEEGFGLFAELPMASEWLEENLEFFAELPMASEGMD